MRVVCDAEADGLQPTKFWVICAKEIDTGETWEFDRPYRDEYRGFQEFARKVDVWIGHNFLGYDLPHFHRLIPGVDIHPDDVIDTLVVSKLVNFGRPGGHSLEQFGKELGYVKVEQDRWDQYDPNMLVRCRTDVDINCAVYRKLEPYINAKRWRRALEVEHKTAWACEELHRTGFAFDTQGAKQLLGKIQAEVAEIDEALQVAFPPRPKLVREVVPRATKHGTIAKNSIPKVLGNDLSFFTVDAPFSLIEYEEFNPGSNKQRVERLWAAGWKPTNKTDGHIDFLKEKVDDPVKQKHYEFYGWKTDDENLATLPEDAPDATKSLVRRLLLASRVSRLEEWLGAVGRDGRIHGRFQGIGAWTHRMSHSAPNMGNIPRLDEKQPWKTPYSGEMRALWQAAPDRYLVGVDAESIQLRVLAHYIDDAEFTYALLQGKKEDGTDPHSVNQRAIGAVCRSRDDAKTFIYAWLLGAGVKKVAEILGCSVEEAAKAVDNFLDRYQKLRYTKDVRIPEDAARGYFEGFDGRLVKIRGETQGAREHYTLGGYLQNGEALVMKYARVMWEQQLQDLSLPYWFVNFVHDEYQLETIRDIPTATKVAEVVADSIRQAGERFNLRCPMAGSILNGHGKLAIGDTWMDTH